MQVTCLYEGARQGRLVVYSSMFSGSAAAVACAGLGEPDLLVGKFFQSLPAEQDPKGYQTQP